MLAVTAASSPPRQNVIDAAAPSRSGLAHLTSGVGGVGLGVGGGLMRPNKPVRKTVLAESEGELHSWREVNAHLRTTLPSLFINSSATVCDYK